MAASPASARASNGVWSASTATGPIIPGARPPDRSRFRDRLTKRAPDSGAFAFVLEMFHVSARLTLGVVEGRRHVPIRRNFDVAADGRGRPVRRGGIGRGRPGAGPGQPAECAGRV